MFKALKTSTKIIIGILLLLFVIRLALPSIVKQYVNKQLNELPGYTGHVEDIDISLWRGAYAIDQLTLKKLSDTSSYPFLQIAHCDLSVEWKSLWKGKLVSEIILDRPTIHILKETADLSKEPSQEHWTETVNSLMPITINRLQVNQGTFKYLDRQASPQVNLSMDSLQLTAYNLANADEQTELLPSTVTLTGTSIGGGKLKADMKLNILKKMPDFDTDMQLTDVNLTSLNGFIEAYGKFDVERGSLNLYSELKLIDGSLDGYAKPFITNLKVLNWEKDRKEGGFLRAAKEAVIGLFGKVVENPKRETIATKVDIKGNVNDPDTSSWAAFLGILKNAFIKAFNQGIEGSLNQD
ncbi:DUF748 domain-containing protein [Sphingobacterium pedocola]|uniref:DUF748 domain-containing protein n=1 Tax=Sphingobacterium pedocola TaxID=2082722 RepID=A0ABR9T2M9_9SPHI|nr:DUF748 domain-containing protein [Sphingobacterium pedocola]MBE8719594.1 hypothetical protein [Sphingobacterium pedocola]